MFKTAQAQKIFGIWHKADSCWVRNSAGVIDIFGEDQAFKWFGENETYQIKELFICCEHDLVDTRISQHQKTLEEAIAQAKFSLETI
jgi:hypothetical protein